MNDFVAKIWLFVALCAIVALALVAIGPGAHPGQGTVDPFRGASQMPGDPTNNWSSRYADPSGAKPAASRGGEDLQEGYSSQRTIAEVKN